MKKLILVLTLAVGISVAAQENSTVKKSLTGVEVGFFAADVYNEAKLSEEWVLRSQLSLNFFIWGGDLYSRTGFALTPSLSIAPKYYYNLNRRSENGKNTKNNSANFLSLSVEYFPSWSTISNEKDVRVNDGLFFTPTYGIRRNFAENFNYEFRAGIGLGTLFQDNSGLQTRLDLSFKVGYDF